MKFKKQIEKLQARLDRVEALLRIRPSPPPYYNLTPASGLHRLKDGWSQVASMVRQCRWLCEELDTAIGVTRILAPDRRRNQGGFRLLDRIARGRPNNGEERQLEWDLYNCWRLGHNAQDAQHPFWSRLIGFQVPLYDNVLHDGWDKIDLVAVLENGEPAIIELKIGSSEEKPLRPLLEAAGYGVALRKVWNELQDEDQVLDGFRDELQAVVADQGIDLNVELEPTNFHLIVLAPSQYWNYLRQNNSITAEHWQHFRNLADLFGEKGYPVKFVELVGGGPEFQVQEVQIPSK